jgi:hypothetical protein
MVALERRIEALFDRLHGEVREHPETASAFERFHTTSKSHQDVLTTHARQLGKPTASEDPMGPAAPTDLPPAPTPAGDGVCTGRVSQALRAAALALNDATIGYSVLHEAAHVFDSVRYAATLRIAERHLRGYARAVQEINQLIAEVVAWELRQAGQSCACTCPACGLGICWCAAHTTDAIAAAWRETAPAYPSGGLRVAPNSRRPPDLDVREGDVVIAVDGRRVASTADVTAAVLARGRGEPITFGIERPSVGALEITTTRR